jgi:hypothetical protein
MGRRARAVLAGLLECRGTADVSGRAPGADYSISWSWLVPRRASAFAGGPDTPPTIEVAPTAFTYLESPTQTRQVPLEGTPPAGPQELTPERLAQAYRRAAGNLTRAARLLGVHRATLYRRMQALGLRRDDLAAAPTTTTGARE